MSDKIYATPAKGVKVRNPEKPQGGDDAFLPEDGAYVTQGTYWTRRGRDGDVTITKSAPRKAKPKGTEV